ncbi:DUF6984 family protein [Paraburkholderia sp. SIMBA_030]|uniref:DUF6984 family protein n=1 Tax=Paraburkholderia sp. SIMBA_030 TaxID=3085773 RepID=UPI00397CAABF
MELSFRYIDMLRELTSHEKSFICGVANRLGVEARDRLMDDLSRAQAEPLLADGALVRFHLVGYQRAPYVGQRLFPVEGAMEDKDGSQMQLLLFADPADRLFELEYLRWDGDALQAPNWSTLRFVPDVIAAKNGAANP